MAPPSDLSDFISSTNQHQLRGPINPSSPCVVYWHGRERTQASSTDHPLPAERVPKFIIEERSYHYGKGRLRSVRGPCARAHVSSGYPVTAPRSLPPPSVRPSVLTGEIRRRRGEVDRISRKLVVGAKRTFDFPYGSKFGIWKKMRHVERFAVRCKERRMKSKPPPHCRSQ